jgi:phosphatidylcholine synthase
MAQASGSFEDPPHFIGRRLLAWAVHLFTATGAVLGVLSLTFINQGDLARASLVMIITSAIDSVDGTMARAVRVTEFAPAVDGRRLDDMVDFLNFVIVPAAFMVQAGHLPSWGWVVLPVLASCYGFSHHEAKTPDDFFLGWPSYWNVVAVYFYLLGTSQLVNVLWVVGLSIMVFVPLKYIYPSKMPALRVATNIGVFLYAATIWVAVAYPEQASRVHLAQVSLAFPAYYIAMSVWLGDWWGIRTRWIERAG